MNLLIGTGSVSNKQMEAFVDKVYNKFDEKRKNYELEQADKEDMKDYLLLDLVFSEQSVKETFSSRKTELLYFVCVYT